MIHGATVGTGPTSTSTRTVRPSQVGTFTIGSFAQQTITNVPTGQMLTITVTEGGWPLEMSWSLRYEKRRPDHEFLRYGDSSSGPAIYLVFGLWLEWRNSGSEYLSANIPSGADHLLTFAALTGGTNSLVAWTSIVDFRPPAHSPSSIQFTDTDYSAGVIAGTLSIGRATSETDISHYNIYFGTSSTQKFSQGSGPLSAVAVTSSTGSTVIEVSLASTNVPANAFYLLAV